MNIYVGNISYQLSETELEQAFGRFGEVSTVKIIKDRETGRSKGFAFVEMPVEEDAQAAIRELDGSTLGGRPIKVNMARPREDRPRGDRPPRRPKQFD